MVTIVADTNQSPNVIQEMYWVGMANKAFRRRFTRKIVVSDVYALVSGAISQPDDREEVIEALKNNQLLRSHYQALLNKKRRFFVPVAAAAASENMILERRTTEFSIKIISSKHKAGTSYIVVELLGDSVSALGKRLVVHASSDAVIESAVFSNVHDSKAQIVVSDSDPFLKAVGDRNTEISIVFE